MIKRVLTGVLAGVMGLSLVACGSIIGPQAPKDIAKTGTVAEAVIYDVNNVVIKTTGIEYGNWKANVQLEVTNNSNKDLSITTGTMGYSSNSVNGYMIKSAYVNEDVAAKSTVNTEVGLDYSELQALGIEKIANICLAFTIHGDDYLYTDPIEIKTSFDAGYDYNRDSFKDAMNSGVLEYLGDCTAQKKSQEVLYDNAGVKFDAYGYYVKEAEDEDDEDMHQLVYEIYNTTDTHIGAKISDIKVNGKLISDGTWDADLINPHCRNVTTLKVDYLMDMDEWEEAGIEEIENISFTVGVFDKRGKELGKEKEVTLGVK